MEGGIDGENVDIETTELHYAARTGDATTIQVWCLHELLGLFSMRMFMYQGSLT